MFLYNKEKDPNTFTLMPGQMTETQDKLEAGVYNLIPVSQGMSAPPLMTFERTVKYNNGMTIEGGVFTQARETVAKFVQPEMYTAREAMGMMHKVGVIFNGKPGTGKTFLSGQIAAQFAKDHNAIGIISTQHKLPYSQIIDHIREFDKDRLIVLVMDEFEKSSARHWSEMLSFLDGTDSRDNVIVIATINEISEMPTYLRDRPGRFEHILDFRSDDKLVLKSIITQCIPDDYKEQFDIDELIKQFTTKANASKFGLKNERDDFTVDRIRIVIRDLLADKIKNADDNETVEVDVTAQVEAATAAINSVDTDKSLEKFDSEYDDFMEMVQEIMIGDTVDESS